MNNKTKIAINKSKTHPLASTLLLVATGVIIPGVVLEPVVGVTIPGAVLEPVVGTFVNLKTALFLSVGFNSGPADKVSPSI
jgi:hypothetical protein